MRKFLEKTMRKVREKLMRKFREKMEIMQKNENFAKNIEFLKTNSKFKLRKFIQKD